MRTLTILLSALATQASGDLCTGGAASGTGLRGAYYNADPRVSRPTLVRVDPRVESATIKSLPAQVARTEVRWVRWCGFVRPVVSGPHRFRSASPAMSIRVAQQVVAGPDAAAGKPITLEAGKAYAILIEVPNPATAGEFSLQWIQPFGAALDMPPTVLFAPIETVQPGC